MSSIYFSPQNYNVTLIDGFDVYEPDWDFDILLVVKDTQSGQVYAATDSGCSCPIPFEDHKYPNDFIHVRSWQDVKDILDREFPINRYSRKRLPHDGLRRRVQAAL